MCWQRSAAGAGVVVSQKVPFPWGTSLLVVADDQAAQKALDPTLQAGFVSLEGTLSGRFAAAALELAGPKPTGRSADRRFVMELRAGTFRGGLLGWVE
jgi:hypothetical protein